MDKIDKKILFELEMDGFQPYSSIAKKVRVSKQVVGYRLRRMEEENILRKVYPVINLEKLGYEGQKVFFQMHNVDEKKIIDYFMHKQGVMWFGLYEGRFDFVVSIFEKNKVEFEKTLSQIITDLKDYVLDFEIASYTGIQVLKKKYLSEKQASLSSSFIGRGDRPTELDILNKKILKELSKDTRQTSVELGQKIGLSSDAVIKRIKKLRLEGIIEGSRVMLNKRGLKINEFKLLLKLQNFNDSIHKRLAAFCKENKYVVAYIKTIGPWNLELDIEIPNLDELHLLLMNLKTEFSDSIKTIETLMLHDEYRYDFYPFDI